MSISGFLQNISSTRWRFGSLLFRMYPQCPEQCPAQSGVSVNEQIQGKKPGDVLKCLVRHSGSGPEEAGLWKMRPLLPPLLDALH